MKTITKIAALTLAALLAACGGGDDEPAAPVDVWQVPASGPAARATCSASIVPTATTSMKVTVKTSRTLSAAAGSLGLRSFAVYSTDGLSSSVAFKYREGAAPGQPIHADDENAFWAPVQAGKQFTVTAYGEVRGQTGAGSVLTTDFCAIAIE